MASSAPPMMRLTGLNTLTASAATLPMPVASDVMPVPSVANMPALPTPENLKAFFQASKPCIPPRPKPPIKPLPPANALNTFAAAALSSCCLRCMAISPASSPRVSAERRIAKSPALSAAASFTPAEIALSRARFCCSAARAAVSRAFASASAVAAAF